MPPSFGFVAYLTCGRLSRRQPFTWRGAKSARKVDTGIKRYGDGFFVGEAPDVEFEVGVEVEDEDGDKVVELARMAFIVLSRFAMMGGTNKPLKATLWEACEHDLQILVNIMDRIVCFQQCLVKYRASSKT